MKKKSKLAIFLRRIIPIIVMSTIAGVSCFFIGKKIGLNTDTSKTNTSIEDVKVEKQTINKTLTVSGSIESSSSEKLELNTSYYYDSIYVEEDDIVKKGDKILKYTNGKYLYAPYDLLISKINVPSNDEKCTSSNYIEVENIESLKVNISVNESEISSIKAGQEVSIVLNADSSKKYTGKISKIGSIGTYSTSGTTFPITVIIENDGYIKVGMSVSCTIEIEKLDSVVAVPIGAVNINKDRRYVVLVDGDNTKEVNVTTGVSDDTYVEIKSGVEEGDTVRVVTVTKQSVIRNSSSSDSKSKFSGMPEGFSGKSRSSSGSGNFPNMPDVGNMPNTGERK